MQHKIDDAERELGSGHPQRLTALNRGDRARREQQREERQTGRLPQSVEPCPERRHGREQGDCGGDGAGMPRNGQGREFKRRCRPVEAQRQDAERYEQQRVRNGPAGTNRPDRPNHRRRAAQIHQHRQGHRVGDHESEQPVLNQTHDDGGAANRIERRLLDKIRHDQDFGRQQGRNEAEARRQAETRRRRAAARQWRLNRSRSTGAGSRSRTASRTPR